VTWETNHVRCGACLDDLPPVHDRDSLAGLRDDRQSGYSGQTVRSGVGPGGDVAEVETANAVEGGFGGAGEAPVGQDRVLLAVPAGEVGGEAPLLGRSEVTQPHRGRSSSVVVPVT